MDGKDRGQGEDLVIVYRAPDEISAGMVKSYLDDEGIPAVIESRMVPWYDGVFRAGEGMWGTVVVPLEHAERAKQIIQVFLDGVGESTEGQ